MTDVHTSIDLFTGLEYATYALELLSSLYFVSSMAINGTGYVSITHLLKRLSTAESTKSVKAEEVAAALALVFTDSISPVQFGLLLWALHVQEGDSHPKVLTACAQVMREAAAQVDENALTDVVKRKGRPEGRYAGGLVCCPFVFAQKVF